MSSIVRALKVGAVVGVCVSQSFVTSLQLDSSGRGSGKSVVRRKTGGSGPTDPALRRELASTNYFKGVIEEGETSDVQAEDEALRAIEKKNKAEAKAETGSDAGSVSSRDMWDAGAKKFDGTPLQVEERTENNKQMTKNKHQKAWMSNTVNPGSGGQFIAPASVVKQQQGSKRNHPLIWKKYGSDAEGEPVNLSSICSPLYRPANKTKKTPPKNLLTRQSFALTKSCYGP